MKHVWTFWLLVVGSLLPEAAHAQQKFQRPKIAAQADVYLMTTGVGNELHERGGHVLLRIHDRHQGTDFAYNWGIFDFAEPGFIWKFYKGTLLYTVAAWDYQMALAHYGRLKRDVWLDRLALTDAEKERIFDRVAWWFEPENSRYPYNIWHQNCATIARDVIDEAVDGKLRAQFAGVETGKTFRHYARSSTVPWMPIYVGLDILLSAEVDSAMTAWQHMHRPLAIRDYLQKVTLDRATGEVPLIDDSETPFASKMAPDSTVSPYAWLALCLYPFSLISILFIGLSPNGKWSNRLLGLEKLLFGAGGTLFAVLMMTNWLFTLHTYYHGNINLLVFWPASVASIYFGWRTVRKPQTHCAKLTRVETSLAVTHTVILVALACSFALGLFEQNIGLFAVTFFPLIIQHHAKVVFAARFAPSGIAEQSTRRPQGDSEALAS